MSKNSLALATALYAFASTDEAGEKFHRCSPAERLDGLLKGMPVIEPRPAAFSWWVSVVDTPPSGWTRREEMASYAEALGWKFIDAGWNPWQRCPSGLASVTTPVDLLDLFLVRGRVDLVKAMLKRPGAPSVEAMLERKYGVELGSAAEPCLVPLLSLAVQENHLQLVRWLLPLGADVSQVDSLGRSPLHCARTVAMVKLLLAHGATADITDHQGYTPVELWLSREKQKSVMAMGAEVGKKAPGALTALNRQCLVAAHLASGDNEPASVPPVLSLLRALGPAAWSPFIHPAQGLTSTLLLEALGPMEREVPFAQPAEVGAWLLANRPKKAVGLARCKGVQDDEAAWVAWMALAPSRLEDARVPARSLLEMAPKLTALLNQGWLSERTLSVFGEFFKAMLEGGSPRFRKQYQGFVTEDLSAAFVPNEKGQTLAGQWLAACAKGNTSVISWGSSGLTGSLRDWIAQEKPVPMDCLLPAMDMLVSTCHQGVSAETEKAFAALVDHPMPQKEDLFPSQGWSDPSVMLAWWINQGLAQRPPGSSLAAAWSGVDTTGLPPSLGLWFKGWRSRLVEERLAGVLERGAPPDLPKCRL